ncbi:DsbC family protein [Undibacterium sp. Jales W-56]|uniref:DsbC family protein n=1 Tax=Undibacterium sp. Jales W-56 TaxID=2897325 RepID=UPI0021D39ED3|nr:DsbC family protein [Undibacterium sp. Jales W-56]MCU6435148.1 DsbC family protein [Undibacterium sp. Jales W-56]
MNIKSLIAALLILPAAFALAETPQEAAVKKLVEPRLNEGTKVDSVTKTPYAGLFEVRVGSDVIYTDEKAQYLFIGNVIDARNSKNYTKIRVDELSRVKFADLPLESALKTVRGNGKRVIAIFEDPNCGYCKRFRKTLQDVDNITVYTFMYNILAEDSSIKSRNIWCTADRNKAWDDWMLNGKAAATAAPSCDTPNEKIFELGKKLRVSGTPTVFFADGSRLPGAVDVKGLEDKFSSLK